MCLGVPGRVVELVDDPPQHARVDLEGRLRVVSVAMLAADGVRVGDWVVVHQGFALDRIEPAEAHRLLQERRELLETYERELADPR